MALGVAPKWVNVGDVQTRYFEAGSGEPLLLLPGGTIGAEGASIAETWDLNFLVLAKRYRVFILDKLGQGHTANPLRDEDYCKTAKLNHIADFLRALGLPAVHVAGQSRGGFMAIMLTLRFPELVSSCTVVNSSSMAPGVSLTHLVTGGTCPYPLFSREAQRWVFAHTDFSDETVPEDFVEEGYKVLQLPKYQESHRKMWKEGLASRYYYPDEARLREEAHYRLNLQGTGRPTQIIWGDSDSTATLHRGITLYNMIAARQRHAYLNVFTNAGHHPYRDHPVYFNEMMLGFLDLVSSQPSRG
jgi:2-hydroxy-6-oxonona-2,4-dienedioate hydrolase